MSLQDNDDGQMRLVAGVGLVPSGPRREDPGDCSRFQRPRPRVACHFPFLPRPQNAVTNSLSPDHHNNSSLQASTTQDSRIHVSSPTRNINNVQTRQDPRTTSGEELRIAFENPWQYMSALQGLENRRQRLSRMAEQGRDERRLLSRERFNENHSGGSPSNHVKNKHSDNNVVFTDDGKRVKSEETSTSDVSTLSSIESRPRGESSIDTQQDRSPWTPINPIKSHKRRKGDHSSPPDKEHEPGPPSGPDPNLTPSSDNSKRSRCQCPIGRTCEAKTNELIDCRTLVLENKAWGNWLNERKELFQST